MKYQCTNTRIVGMSTAVPAETSENIIPGDDKKAQRLFKMTGIERRHTINPERMRLVDLAIAAAKDVIGKSKVDPQKIRFIVYMTQHPEFVGPSTAFYVQKELNLGKDCLVFDMNLGCSGFVAGLEIATSLVAGMPDGSLALLLNAEYLSSVKRENANDEFLFGDAVSAVMIEKDSHLSEKYLSDYYSDGTRYKAIFHELQGGKCHMDGQAVFEFSIYEVSGYISNFMKENNLTDADIDHVVFHQAQRFMIDHMATNVNLDKAKMLYSLDEYANTSGASIPLSICRNRDRLKEHGRYLVSGFGVGLAWGVAYLEINRENIFDVLVV